MEPAFLMLAVLPFLHPHPQPFAGLRVWRRVFPEPIHAFYQ